MFNQTIKTEPPHPRKGRTTLSESKPRLLKARSKTRVFLHIGGTHQEAKKPPKIIPCSGTETDTDTGWVKLNHHHSVSNYSIDHPFTNYHNFK